VRIQTIKCSKKVKGSRLTVGNIGPLDGLLIRGIKIFKFVLNITVPRDVRVIDFDTLFRGDSFAIYNGSWVKRVTVSEVGFCYQAAWISDVRWDQWRAVN